MSFAFGFSGDDIENESDNDDSLVQQVENYSIDATPLIQPKRHSLQELLHSLPSQVSYNLLRIAGQPSAQIENGSAANTTVPVPRRSVFDIRTQLMAEANPEENENDTLLAGLERGDLTSGVYEGGFKTWECSIDLASLLAEYVTEADLHVVELGAGSAIPSLLLLHKALRQTSYCPIRFTLCDYNEDVLRLATAPNIFLASETSGQTDLRTDDVDDLDIEDVDAEKVENCIQHLQSKGLSFEFISGAWGEEFIQMLMSHSQRGSDTSAPMLILASETIYSPKSTRVFAEVLMQLLRQNAARNRAWIAAKKVYFGVGGGIDDFIGQIKRLNGLVDVLLDVKGAGVGRVVLEVTAG